MLRLTRHCRRVRRRPSACAAPSPRPLLPPPAPRGHATRRVVGAGDHQGASPTRASQALRPCPRPGGAVALDVAPPPAHPSFCLLPHDDAPPIRSSPGASPALRLLGHRCRARALRPLGHGCRHPLGHPDLRLPASVATPSLRPRPAESRSRSGTLRRRPPSRSPSIAPLTNPGNALHMQHTSTRLVLNVVNKLRSRESKSLPERSA